MRGLADTIRRHVYRLAKILGDVVATAMGLLLLYVGVRYPIPWLWRLWPSLMWRILCVPLVIVWLATLGLIEYTLFAIRHVITKNLIRSTRMPILFSQLTPDKGADALIAMPDTDARIDIVERLEKTCAWKIMQVVSQKYHQEFVIILKHLDGEKLRDYLLRENYPKRRILANRLGVEVPLRNHEDSDAHQYHSSSEYAFEYRKPPARELTNEGTRPSSLDDIFDALDVLRRDADNLNRYGVPINSAILFQHMSNDDRRRVIYCALTIGDKAVRDTANHFVQQLDPIPISVDELSSQMDPRHKCEIDAIVEQGRRRRIISNQDLRQISQILCEACCSMSGLTQEEAYWVLIPTNLSDAPVRMKAMGIASGINVCVQSFSHVLYEPDNKEMRSLFAAMRRSAWALHIHNHPVTAGEQNACSASLADLEFARHWKSLRGELAGKMKFFIVQDGMAIEYTEDKQNEREWIPREDTDQNQDS